MHKGEMLQQIPNINLYHMLCYSFRDLNKITPEALGAESFDQIEALLSAILLEGITRQFRRGLYKEYVEGEGLLQVLRGKIDIHETIRLKTQVSRQVYCHYDEFSVDNIYNQVLKALCLLILKRGRIASQQRKNFKRLLISFHEVQDISLDCVAWGKLSYEKNKFPYKMLIQIGYMIFKGIHLDTNTGKGYLDEVIFNHLYKQCIYRFFETECHGVDVSYEKIADEEEVDSDLILLREGKIMLVHTCFYPELFINQKVTEHKSFLLQEMKKTFYSVRENSMKSKETISGLLLYPSIESTYIEEYMLDQHQIFVAAIDLREPMSAIKVHLKQMSQLV